MPSIRSMGRYLFQCPHELELLHNLLFKSAMRLHVSMPSRAWVVTISQPFHAESNYVSMPSRAWVVTLLGYGNPHIIGMFQCPHGLELLRVNELISASTDGVSMPSRAYTSFLLALFVTYNRVKRNVSMPSRAYTSFLLGCNKWVLHIRNACQCPLGLISHFYWVESM